jgi:hypothetical protein
MNLPLSLSDLAGSEYLNAVVEARALAGGLKPVVL